MGWDGVLPIFDEVAKFGPHLQPVAVLVVGDYHTVLFLGVLQDHAEVQVDQEGFMDND